MRFAVEPLIALLRLAALSAGTACLLSLSGAPAPGPAGFPFTDEDLNYSINWPTGLGLGEAHTHARHTGDNWNFTLTINAGIPGYAVKDTYRSASVTDFCPVSFDRSTAHGSRIVQEKETVDRARSTVTRETLVKDGGKSDFAVPICVKDALTLLFFTRREMGQGRVPGPQQFLYGDLHDVRMDYVGAPMISAGGKQVQSDQLTCTVKTSASDYKFDIYFARDAARTPLLISAPLPIGKFSMELIR
ncbi:MAG: DUF3108 domain-containing protein [Acidobacteriota bacterium]|nr:DUF3108 domain-containing protein [Acidobacteriota bacterium]